MKYTYLLCCAALAAAFFIGAQTMLADPAVTISNRHGNLRAAQGLIVQAFERIGAAQADNRNQLGGHAVKAKELLTQADEELRLAARDAR